MPKSTQPPPTRAAPDVPARDREIVGHVRLLFAVVLLGLVVMIAAAAWAWWRFGPKPSDSENADHPRPTWSR